jgi:hypothetical protein
MAAPADAENDPGSHFAHDAEPTEIEAGAPEYLPAVQSVQTVESVPAAYLPASQSMQTEEPAVAWNLPAGHDVHVAATEEVDPTGPYLPAAHKELEHVEAPAVAWYFPASQLVQTLDPAVDVYFPASQERQE